MTKYTLQFPKEIKSLEDNHQWLDAVTLLYNQWKKNPMDEYNLVCLVMEAWYAMLELEYWEWHPSKPLKSKSVQKKIYDILCEASDVGFKAYSESVLFNMYVGYAADVTPLNFERFIDISKWGATGMEMIHKAYLKDDKDMLTRLFYYASINRSSKEYQTAVREFWSAISVSGWGNTAVPTYFFDMFDGEKCHRTD